MLYGKLRIAPTCYHVFHLMQVMSAHEMNFFYEEGLRDGGGSLAYEILRESIVPFGLEKLGISQMHVSRLQRRALRKLREAIRIEPSECI